MMMKQAFETVSEDDLHAFVDGQLAAERLPALLAWLQTHPEDAARVAAWQRQRLALHRLARGIELDETPRALTDTVLRAGRRARAFAWPQLGALALLMLALGLGGGYWLGGAGQERLAAASPRFVHEAELAHSVFVPEKRHPVEVAASDEAHLVQWLSKRLGAPLTVPSLEQYGFHLLGGRLLPGEGAPRAQFMYEDARGARVTVFVAVFGPGQSPAAMPMRSVSREGGESVYWTSDRYGYALNTSLKRQDADALAREVYAQLLH